MTEEQGFTEASTAPPSETLAQAFSDPAEHEPAAAAAPPEPVEQLEPEQPEPAAAAAAEPVPDVTADPQEVAEQAAAAEPAEAQSATADAADPVLPPFIPTEGVPSWLREALNWLHERVRALEG